MTIRIRRYGRAAGLCLAFASAAAPASALAERVPQLDRGTYYGDIIDAAKPVGCRVAGPLPAGLSLLLGALIAMKRRRRFR